MNFSIEVKNMRSKMRLTQKELAEILGVSRNTIARYEMGTFNPTLDKMERIRKMAEQFGSQEN